MKRFAALFLSSIIVLSLFGCNNKSTEIAETATEVTEYVEVRETLPLGPVEATQTLTLAPSVLELMLADADALRQSILNSSMEITVTGKSYYVSNSGDDSNDGLSPETAWATVKRVSKAKLKPGDGVFFERGGIFREHVLYCQKV